MFLLVFMAGSPSASALQWVALCALIASKSRLYLSIDAVTVDYYVYYYYIYIYIRELGHNAQVVHYCVEFTHEHPF